MDTTTMTAPETMKANQVYTILERCVCLLLTCGYVGNQRKVELGTVEITNGGVALAAEKQEMGAHKRLFDNADLRAANKAIDAAKAYVASMACANAHKMFGAGTYLIPLEHITAVETRLTMFQADIAGHAVTLADRLPEIIEARQLKLGPLFNRADYPTPEEVKAAYSLEWNYVSFGAPDKLMEVSHAVAEAAEAKWQAKMAEAYDEVVVGLRQAAMTVMQELVTRLQPDVNGKVKPIHPTALRDLQALLGKLPVLNITGDDALAAIVARVGAVGGALDAEVLRKAPGVRAMLLERAQDAVTQLDQLVTGRRAMTLPAAKAAVDS